MGCLSPGPLPLFAGLWEESLMRVPNLGLKSVVFLGRMRGSGFVPIGTAFLVTREESNMLFGYLVTCAHILDDIQDDTIYVRINRISGDAEIKDTKRTNWVKHPNPPKRRLVDIAVCQITYQPDYLDLSPIPLIADNILTEDKIVEEDIGIGDEVFTIGLFTRHSDTRRNVPIVRVGNISAMIGEPIWTLGHYIDGYLVEVRSIGGLSGSPVFVQLPPYRSKEISDTEHVVTQSKRTHYLMGMIQGHFEIQNTEDALRDKGEPPGDKVNSGIASVVPIHQIIETVDQPEFAKTRAELVAKKQQEIGFVADHRLS